MTRFAASDPLRPGLASASILLCLSVAACGGGGDGGPVPAVPPVGAAQGDGAGTECIPAPLPAPGAEPVACAAFDDAARARVLGLVNAVRAEARSCGAEAFAAAPALDWNPCLEVAADGHSDDMATHNFFSHTGSDGGRLRDRVNRSGFDWSNIGENIAAGQPSAADALSGWIDSPGHCRNLMNPAFSNLGMACRSDDGADYPGYWTQVFGRSR